MTLRLAVSQHFHSFLYILTCTRIRSASGTLGTGEKQHQTAPGLFLLFIIFFIFIILLFISIIFLSKFLKKRGVFLQSRLEDPIGA